MNAVVKNVVKISMAVAGAGITLVSNYIANKELDEKISKKAAEAVANVMGNVADQI